MARILTGMKKDTDIVIIGGGLNGSALALGLAQIGLKVTIIDSLPVQTRKLADFDGRSYALALASMRLLRGLGLWDSVATDTEPMLEIKVTDGRAGEGPSPWMLHFDHAEIEEGPMGFMCEDRHLRRALLTAMKGSDLITQINGETVTDQTTDGVVTLASGKTINASLIIGADGRNSGTADRAGISRTGWGYDQTAIVCAVEHEKPHEGIAHQFFMPSGPLAILPLKGNRCSIVWSETENRAADIFIADRVALIGDAAHGVHPIAGQGLNAGLRDIGALIDVLQSAKMRGEDIGSPAVLARYEQWRRFDTATLAVATDTFNRLFSNDTPLLRAVRDLGMGLVNATPNLRRNIIREAAGLTGDLPSLMQA